MVGMKKGIFYFLTTFVALNAAPALANWQYSGEYTYDTAYYDNGGRASVSVRGGMTYAMAGMSNDVGSVVYSYCVGADGEFYPTESDGSCAAGLDYAGTGNLGSLGLDDLSEIAFSAGASVGWILPNHPQWRLELGWDHFAEVDYNKTPLFSGDMKFSNGPVYNGFAAGSVQSTMSTDIVSAMAFYDFFDGYVKPAHTMIPYVGIGFGYADTKTVMNIADVYGNLSDFEDLTNFGDLDNGVIHFYKSTTNTSNIAGVAALGFSYGLVENLFLDFGARISYIPRVKYRLVNADDTRKLDWFSAKNLIYANIMLGVRLEF